MRNDPEGILEAAIVAYSLGDIESTLAFFADDSEFAIFVPESIIPFGGTYDGRVAIAKRLHAFVSAFATEKYVARTILPDGPGLRTQIDYSFRHRPTSENIDGVMRVKVQFKNGQIVNWHEYHDADRIDAFMRLINSRTA